MKYEIVFRNLKSEEEAPWTRFLELGQPSCDHEVSWRAKRLCPRPKSMEMETALNGLTELLTQPNPIPPVGFILGETMTFLFLILSLIFYCLLGKGTFTQIYYSMHVEWENE